MTELTCARINDDVLEAMNPPRGLYYVIVGSLGAAVMCFFMAWLYQVKVGMGVAGISHPVGWGVYIGNFVFWVGIAHSGTLISAILHLVRSRWRSAVSRASEAMTIFAIMTAGLFPLIHLGRLWVLYYIFPYPSQRQLWPNFTSALVWDVVAVSTYLTVSLIFWYVGMLPDLAAARDRWTQLKGPSHPRSRLYRRLAIGWTGAGNQWHHYGRSYLFFAALATPLVVSVHSVVSWDFATSLLPGWHATIFPPYFVAGAIHSGLAMVIALLIPMRRILRLERLITVKHLEAVAMTMIVTSLIIGYAYVVEPFMSWYSGDKFEWQFTQWRWTGWLAWATILLPILNVAVPLCFLFKRVRTSLLWLMVVSLLVNAGMWLERFWIVVGSTSHDFLPHNWGPYAPTWVEYTITFGSLGFFLFWFFIFAKVLPTVSIAEVKETVQDRDLPAEHQAGPDAAESVRGATSGVTGVFASARAMLKGVQAARSQWRQVETYSPVRVEAEAVAQDRAASPVRYWTLVGALSGMAGGFALAIGSAMVNGLVVGAKLTSQAIVPYCIIAFEGTVLLGTIFNLTGLLIHCRLGRPKVPIGYDERFSNDKFGVFIACAPEQVDQAAGLLTAAGAQEVRRVG